MKTKTMLLLCLTLVASAPSLYARMSTFGLKFMIHRAQLIVVGEVQSISNEKATIKVLEVIKGVAQSTFELDVRRTWACDTSKASVSETILLFAKKNDGRISICMSGRGRMPISEVDGKSFAEFWTDVVMPKEVEVIDGSKSEYSFIRRANLSDLLQVIKAK